LYSYKIRSWTLCVRQFGVRRVNTAQSSTLLHSYVLNKWAEFSTKIFAYFWDIVIFVLGYFILARAVQHTYRLIEYISFQLSNAWECRHVIQLTCSMPRSVTPHLENPKILGTAAARELTKSQGIVRGKCCRGELFIVSSIFAAALMFCSVSVVLYLICAFVVHWFPVWYCCSAKVHVCTVRLVVTKTWGTVLQNERKCQSILYHWQASCFNRFYCNRYCYCIMLSWSRCWPVNVVRLRPPTDSGVKANLFYLEANLHGCAFYWGRGVVIDPGWTSLLTEHKVICAWSAVLETLCSVMSWWFVVVLIFIGMLALSWNIMKLIISHRIVW